MIKCCISLSGWLGDRVLPYAALGGGEQGLPLAAHLLNIVGVLDGDK